MNVLEWLCTLFAACMIAPFFVYVASYLCTWGYLDSKRYWNQKQREKTIENQRSFKNG